MADVPGPVLANVAVVCCVGADKYRTFRNRRRHEERGAEWLTVQAVFLILPELALFLGILSTLLGIVSTIVHAYQTRLQERSNLLSPCQGMPLCEGVDAEPPRTRKWAFRY